MFGLSLPEIPLIYGSIFRQPKRLNGSTVCQKNVGRYFDFLFKNHVLPLKVGIFLNQIIEKYILQSACLQQRICCIPGPRCFQLFLVILKHMVLAISIDAGTHHIRETL